MYRIYIGLGSIPVRTSPEDPGGRTDIEGRIVELKEIFLECICTGGGISGHFFPEDPSVETFGPVGGRAKCREYAPHSMLTCKGRWWPEQNYKQWI